MHTDQRSSANNIQNEKFANESNGRNPKKDQGSEKSCERILVSYFPNHIEESVSVYHVTYASVIASMSRNSLLEADAISEIK